MENTLLTEDIKNELIATPYFKIGKGYETRNVQSNLYGEQGKHVRKFLDWVIFGSRRNRAFSVQKESCSQNLDPLAF